MTVNPCPFCGSDELEIRPNKMWTGKQYRIYFVELHHYCRIENSPLIYIKVKGRTEEIAIENWNQRS